jgi:RNA-directed DNA polymerase
MMDAKEIRAAIVAEANKLIARYEAYHNALHLEWERSRKRTGTPPPKKVLKPVYWSIDRKFDPFYCRAHSKAIARSISKSIRNGTYEPRPPYEKEIPKASGGTRKLRIYQVPDAAISRILYGRLLGKNKHRFSSFSYAYRDDRNVHFAVQDIFLDLKRDSRTFVAEFDFSDFFGNIGHAYLLSELGQHGLLLSDQDQRLISAFLSREGRGIPQGTSVSLFLANIACLRIDKEFERLGVKFARYADDTVICTPSYEAVCRAVDVLLSFSTNSGVPINFKKSAGIHLLAPNSQPHELRSKHSFDFLGYSIGNEHLSIKTSSVLKIKQEVSYLLYKNLIQPLRAPTLRSVIIPSNNKDEALLTAMMQIRRYICGGLYKESLRRFLKGHTGELRFKGAMGFYPLVTDTNQLKQLDGWLVATIARALRLRAKLLARHGYTRHSAFPFSVRRTDLVKAFDSYRIFNRPLLEVPSFVLVQKAMQTGMREHGISYVMNSKSNDYKR